MRARHQHRIMTKSRILIIAAEGLEQFVPGLGAAAAIRVTPHISSKFIDRSADSATDSFDKSSIILFKSAI